MTDFAAAQKRIRERRAAREQALTAADRQHDAARSADLTRLPPSLRSYAFEFLRAWDVVRSPYGTSPAFRVGQVDAELLDEALLGLLKKQAGEGTKLFGAHLKDDWDAELTLLLRMVYWKLSIWDHGTSYGASLQGLKYIDSRGDQQEAARIRKEATYWQRALYGIITVAGRYGWTRWEERLSTLEGGYDEPSPLIQRLSRLTTFLGTSHNIAAFISFLVFLYNGRYRTLTDRLLRLRLVPSSNQTSREVSFEWLNRQLVWHAFTEFLLFLLPLVGISRWRRWIARAWKKAKGMTARLWHGASSTNLDDEDEDFQKGELAFLPERTCAICYQDQNPTGGQSEQDVISSTSVGANSGIIGSAMTDITNPYQADPCGCIYCFVCLAQRIEAEEGEGWVCLRCGEVVKECRPWHGDVVVRRSRESHSSVESGRPLSGRKSVMFDLQEEEKKQQEREEKEESELEAVDPMPMEDAEESLEWSKLDGEEGYEHDEDEEGDDETGATFEDE
ncbi:Peroxisomal biogenesis factor 2 [Lecanosticta acicola]|uniref:Peroxisomal biogenesis factor 2 n=1 Tax=Lecanosticta acicola TaxID=111012 RepID=A0AAI9ECE2_9PEZI|nr:Peroxisomal biogenesis factor 2 [Lecanosticta acicola]